MTLKFRSFFLLTFILPGMFLAGCGSDGGGSSAPPSYTGVTTQAAITEDNAEDTGKRGSESAKHAIGSDSAGEGTPFSLYRGGESSTSLSEQITEIARTFLEQQSSLNITAGVVITSDQLGFPFCGGSVSAPDNFGSDGTLNGSMTFNNLCFDVGGGETMTMNGTVTFTETSTEITIQYINFSVTFNDGTTETINMTISCDPSFFSCEIYSDFVGDDGRVYRVADFTVTGNESTGYSVDGTFYHPDYGYTTFTTDVPVTFNCANGRPDAGQITFNGSSGSYTTITFRSDCTGYDITWSDGSAGGMISGTW